MADVNVVGNLILQNGDARGAISQIQKQLGNANLKLEFDQKSVSQMLGAFEASRKLGRSVRETGKAFHEAVTQTDAFSRSLAISVRRFGAFFTVAQPILLLVQNLQKATQEFLIFDRQLVKLKQLGSSTVEIGKLVKEIDTLSTTFGVKSNDILKAAETLKQAGFSLNEITKAVKALGQTTLAPTFDDITNTTEGLLAVVQQFNLSIDDSATILSKVNKVAADYAVESRDIIEAVKRTGSTFKLAGGNFDEFLALFTSVRATTRLSAETIANSFKTIFTRIQRPEIIEQLDRLGIQVVDLEGKFIGPFEAIKRLNQALSAVPDASPQFTQLAEKLAGLFQINKLVPLIRQFDVAQQALNTSLGAGNSLYDQSIIAQEALSVKLTKLQEQFFELFRSVGSNTAFRDLIDDMIGLTKWTVQMIRNFEFLTGVLIDLGKVAAVVLSVRTAASIAKFVGATGKSVRLAGGGTTKDGTMGPLFKPQGTDTVPAMLTPGEYVVNRKSAQSNKALLEYINNSKGPVYRADGGPISSDRETYKEIARFKRNFRKTTGVNLRSFYNKLEVKNLNDRDGSFDIGTGNIALRRGIGDPVESFFHEAIHGADTLSGFKQTGRYPSSTDDIASNLKKPNIFNRLASRINSSNYKLPFDIRSASDRKYLQSPPEAIAYTLQDLFFNPSNQIPIDIKSSIHTDLIPQLQNLSKETSIKEALGTRKTLLSKLFSGIGGSFSKLSKFPLGFATGGNVPILSDKDIFDLLGTGISIETFNSIEKANNSGDIQKLRSLLLTNNFSNLVKRLPKPKRSLTTLPQPIQVAQPLGPPNRKTLNSEVEDFFSDKRASDAYLAYSREEIDRRDAEQLKKQNKVAELKAYNEKYYRERKAYLEQRRKGKLKGKFGLLGKLFGYNQGGISGSFYRKPSAEDTVPAMLTPGEYIVNADSAKHNMDLLEQINRNKAPLGFNKGGPVAYLASGGRGNKTQEEIDLERLQRRREQAQKRTDVEGAQERKRVRREDAQRIAEQKAAQRAELDRAREEQRIEQDRVRRIAREVVSGNISREVATSPEFKNRIVNREFFKKNKSIFEAEGIVNADKFDKAIRERKELFKEQEKNRRPFGITGASSVDIAIERRVQEKAQREAQAAQKIQRDAQVKADNIEANKRIRAGFNESGRKAAIEAVQRKRTQKNAQREEQIKARQNVRAAGFTTDLTDGRSARELNGRLRTLNKGMKKFENSTKSVAAQLNKLSANGQLTNSSLRKFTLSLVDAQGTDEALFNKLGLTGNVKDIANQGKIQKERLRLVGDIEKQLNDPKFVAAQSAKVTERTARKANQENLRNIRQNIEEKRLERKEVNRRIRLERLSEGGRSQVALAKVQRDLARGKITQEQADKFNANIIGARPSPGNFPAFSGLFSFGADRRTRQERNRDRKINKDAAFAREASRKGLTVDELKQQNKLQRRNNALKGLGAVAFVAGSGLTQRGGQVDNTLRELFAGGTVGGAGGTGPSPVDALNQAVLFGGIGAQFGGGIGAAAGAGAGLILGIENYQRDLQKAISDDKINKFNKFFEGQLSNQLTESGTRLTEIRGNRNLNQRDINAQSAQEITKSAADSIALLNKQRKVLLANGRAGNITREEFDLQESGIKERATSLVRQNLEQLIGVGATDEQIKPLTDALADLTGQDADILRKSYLAQRDAIKDQIIELDKSAALLAEQNIFYSQIADSSKNLQIAQLRYSDALESIGGITSGAGLKKSSGLSLFGAPRTGTPQDEVNQKAFVDTVKSLTTDQNTIRFASDANILAGSTTEFSKFVEANKGSFETQKGIEDALRSFAEQSGIQNIDEFIKAFRVRSNEIVQNGVINNNVIQQVIQDYIQQTGQVIDTLKAEEEFRKSLNESIIQSKVTIIGLENNLNKLSISTQDSLVSLNDLRSDSLALVDPRFANNNRGPQFNFADIDTQAQDARNNIASLNDLDLTKDTRVEQAKYIQSIQNSIEALDKFANSTQKISQLQQTIQKVQASQQNKLGFVEQFLTSDQAGRFQIARNVNDAQLVGRALNGGNRQVLNQMTPADLKRILETFRGFGDNQVGTTGASGNQLAQELLNQLARMNPILARFLGNNGDILGGGDEGRAERLRNSEEAIAALGEQTIPGLVVQIENEIAKREEAVQSIEEFNKALINFQIKQQEAAQNIAEAALNSKPQVANIQAQQVNVNQAQEVAPQARAFGGSIKPRAVGSDTVPAMLTPGEFIVNAQAARKNKGILNLINSGKVALMRRGGPVDNIKNRDIEDIYGFYDPKVNSGRTGGLRNKQFRNIQTSQDKRREAGKARYEAEQERKRNERTAERNRIQREREIQQQERRRRYESGESGRIRNGVQTDSRIQNSGKGAAVARPDQTRPKAFAQNLKEERGARQNGGVGAANINMQDFQNFAASINAAADKFANIKIPETININTNGKVEVILNGAQVLASITGDLQKQIAIEIQNQIPKIIEAATAKIQNAPPVA